MTSLSIRIAIVIGIISIAVGSFFYHKSVVSSFESDIFSLKMAYSQAHAQALANAMLINKEILSDREVKYAETHEASKVAAISIAKAESKYGDVDIDGMLPISASDAVIMQYEGVCSGSVCGVTP